MIVPHKIEQLPADRTAAGNEELHGSRHPLVTQLCQLMADPAGPFSKRPKPGYLRGIDFYSVHNLLMILQAMGDAFRKTHGRYPDIVAPEMLSDKIFASKFLRPLKVPQSGNKLLTSSFIPQAARELTSCAPIIWHSPVAKVPRGDAIEPGVYYLKTSHGCDMYRRIAYPLNDEQADALDEEFGRYLKRRYGVASGNWWHNVFKPELMVEKAIGSKEFTTSLNYLVIGGEIVRLVAFQKLADGYRKTNFDPDWTAEADQDTQPAQFRMPSDAAKERMAEAARLIGAKLGYVRVDFLLDDDERPFLGEVTFTPGNGLNPMSPELEEKLGKMWDWSDAVG